MAAQPAPRADAGDDSVDVAGDAEGTPGWFPYPDDIVGWTRTSNVDIATAPAWPRLDHERLDQTLNAFAAKRALLCRFRSRTPCTKDVICHAILVEAEDSAEAYGLFTAMLIDAPDQRVGTLSAAVISGDTYERMCWQGRYAAFVRTAEATTDMARSCVDKLAAGLVEPIHSATPPLIFHYFPRARRIPGEAWFFRRSLEALPARVRAKTMGGRQQDVARFLRLDGGTDCAVVGYDPGDGQPPNYVWLVQYPTPQEAQDAADRYKAALGSAEPAADDLVEGPVGVFVCGTWTRGQESLPDMNIMQQILHKLPK